MSDSAHATVSADRPPDSGPSAEVTDALASSPAHGGLVVGERWHDFTIESEWPTGGPGAFIAEEVGSLKKVIIRAFPLGPSAEWRRGAWERLCALPQLQTVRCISAEEILGWRYEISALPPPMTLREFLACHRPNFEEIESMVRQLSATLGALHAQGVVHLGLCPESIYIDESGEAPVYFIGGFEGATLYTQPELMPAEVDARYAPPEAFAESCYLPGTKWCAWDWWSLGRVVQEFLLGRHVLGKLLDCDVSQKTAGLQRSAELLLLEREPAGVRAGAVEKVPVESALTPLLRGLLTGSCEGRWGLDAVQRWLKHEPVQDHYDLPRTARMWVYKGRSFTLAEAAEYFCQAVNWEEGEDMLFRVDRPETLAAFLRDSRGHREDADRLQVVCDSTEAAPWGDVPMGARRTVTAAVAWLALANGSGVRTAMRVRGHSIDPLGLADLIKTSGPAGSVAIMTALLSPAVISFVEPHDAQAARVLTSIASKANEAIKHGVEHSWLDLNDVPAQARLFELSLKAGALLKEKVELLRSQYATNRNEALAKILATKSATPRDTVILALTAEAPPRYGYITHDEWRHQCLGTLKAEADRVVSALFWLQARKLLAATRVWGLPTPIFAGAVLVLTCGAALLNRSFTAPAVVAAALLLARFYFWRRMGSLVRTFAPDAGPWKWTDGSARAAKHATEQESSQRLSPAQRAAELTRLRGEMAQLAKATKHAPVVTEPRWWDLWLVMLGSAAVTLGVFGVGFAQRFHPLEKLEAIAPPVALPGQPAPAVGESGKPIPDAKPLVPPVDVDALLASGRYELVDDGFGRQLRGPLREWTFYATGAESPVEVVEQAPASPEQSAFALVSGTVLLQPYRRKAVNVLLAVRVPTTRGFGFLVFNTRDRQLLDHEVRLARQPLQDHTWFQLGSRRILYLGTPTALEAEISLAPP
jgi:hypothetical protein